MPIRHGCDTHRAIVSNARRYPTHDDDMLLGANTPDELYGGAGNDTLACYGGVDLADGGSGQDALRRPAPPPACETMISIP
jgi:hypothetical protein